VAGRGEKRRFAVKIQAVPRTAPSKGFLAREQHRVLLTVHALVMICGLLACALVNRRMSPDRFWVQWVALAWGALFLLHLGIFSRGTLATMGKKR
jgi:hypothetical protein